jgi:hypothetical protein
MAEILVWFKTFIIIHNGHMLIKCQICESPGTYFSS